MDSSLYSKSSFFNYLGQIRVYSVIDLIFLLIAAQAGYFMFAGALLLHFGFIFYLEYKHSHSYRKSIPFWTWTLFIIFGTFFYASFSVIGFLLASYLYAEKQRPSFAQFAPIFRGLQCFFLIGGIVGYLDFLPLVAFAASLVRNLAGDLRDVQKDRKEGMKTIPVLFGFRKSFSSIHLIFIFLTTILWWSFTSISWIYLIAALLLEALFYPITPR